MSPGVGERAAASPFIESALLATLQVLRGRDEGDEAKDLESLTQLDYNEAEDRELREGFKSKMGPSPLAFPGDVVVDEDNDRLYIADTGCAALLCGCALIHLSIVCTRIEL